MRRNARLPEFCKLIASVATCCFIISGTISPALAQNPAHSALLQQSLADDPCGFDPVQAQHMLQVLGAGWGYGYDSLLVDLERWQQSPYVQIDSAGASVQNRTLWLLSITDPAQGTEPKIRVWIHARTHPGEVQGFWVTNEIINTLLAETPAALNLRAKCVFNIMPMYNPDGVELGYARENAHGVDIESNWNTTPGEPEVNVIRDLFATFMASEMPIRVALNMHSAFACKRYFVYHDAAGTSPAFAEDEKLFIGDIRQYWMEGFENWDYFVSWRNGTPRVYPESWFWLNHREAVMALTYEDMNCTDAGDYDRTADAILQGVSDYLGINPPTGITQSSGTDTPPGQFALLPAYPNPLYDGAAGKIEIQLASAMPVRILLYNILGKLVNVLEDGPLAAGKHTWLLPSAGLPSGLYALQLQTPQGSKTQMVSIVH